MKSNTSTPSTTSTSLNLPQPPSTFYLLWFAISLFQAWGTELFDDEAYYWVYSKFLDWGYFDHPPMIALMVKLGYALFHGELGVRLLSVVLSTATIWMLEKITKPDNYKLFFSIILNIALLQILGILAVPDTPLLFFTVLFFWSYQRYADKSSPSNAILLAIVIACLLYSKYHGILIVLAALLSNVKLLSKPATYLVLILSVALFTPHIIWQINHGYPSIVYQLFERVSPPYNISFTTDYLLGQLLVAGPFAGWLIIYAAFTYKVQSPMHKAMRWSLILVYALFFLSSFKSRTEANWTIPLIAPLIVLSYHYLSTDPQKTHWLYKITPITLVIVFLLRIYMFVDITPWKFMPKDEFHGNKSWAEAIKQKAAGSSVIFTDSYQRASKYWFYSGDTSFSLNTFRYRRSNYNFWPIEAQLQNRKVMIVGSMGAAPMTDSIVTSKKFFASAFIDSFHSFSGIELKSIAPVFVNDGKINAALSYHLSDNRMYNQIAIFKPRVCIIIYQDAKKLPTIVTSTSRVFRQHDNMLLLVTDMPKELNGDKYTIRFGLENSFSDVSINSRAYTLVKR